MSSKEVTWNSGQRSKQYYALRSGWAWKLSSKTRDPVVVIRAEWGSEVDVVTLMALSPGPAVRDWRRYNENLEIADLGRNERLAKQTLKTLQKESSDEERRVRAADEDRVGDVLDRMRTEANTEYSDAIARSISENGLLSYLESTSSEPQIASLFATTALSNILKEEEEVEEVEEVEDSADLLHRQLSELKSELLSDLLGNDRHQNWLGDRLLAEIRDYGTKCLCAEIDEWLVDLRTVIEARAELANRAVLLREQQRRELALGWVEENGVSADVS